ncbi:DUF1489 domain-containing protein [Fodinicurvata sp. EGI_FJ10296]|uniref:DUF1489 family protein n=1 Tax=Fodinicurvata sp. EGI_FJ10296 TaxID=3231908 RepID=UPI003453692D
MAVHLLKTAVGIADVASLQARQAARAGQHGGRDVVFGYTRRRPTRADEVLDGGSIYWIIKGVICVRQRILGLDEERDDEGKPFCLMVFDPALIETAGLPRRAIQGWRYLRPDDAPPDLDGAGSAEDDALPPELARELREMGVV